MTPRVSLATALLFEFAEDVHELGQFVGGDSIGLQFVEISFKFGLDEFSVLFEIWDFYVCRFFHFIIIICPALGDTLLFFSRKHGWSFKLDELNVRKGGDKETIRAIKQLAH